MATAHKFEPLQKSRIIHWQGFNYEWNTTSHRLSYLGSQCKNIKALSTSSRLNADHEFTLKIGNFPSDSADYSIKYSGINCTAFFIGWGTTSIRGVSSEIGHGGESFVTIRKKISDIHSYGDYKELNRNNHSSVKVLLNGFIIQSANFDSGWHFGGLGISVYDARWLSDTEIEFTLWIYARPANSSDLLTKYSGNCVYEFMVDYQVLIGNPYQMRTTDKTLENTVARDTSVTPLWDTKITGITGPRYGYVGLYGFEFHVDEPTEGGGGLSGASGRYIGSLGNYIYDQSYDSATGEGKFKAEQRFSGYASQPDLANPASWLPEVVDYFSLRSKMHCCLIQAVMGDFTFIQKNLDKQTNDELTNIERVTINV